MGAHHFDIAQWALDMDGSGPVKIVPPETKDGKMATSGLKFVYANGIEMFHGGPSGCTFEGTEGTIYVDRDKLESMPDKILKEPLPKDGFRVYPSNDHRKNWLECLRNRKETICPRRGRPPLRDDLPPGQHRLLARPRAGVGPGEGDI